MTLLIPLGLLGLISIAVLIAIYLIKPNFQHKYVSSTYVWKLSIKYKKKRIPINKLRNLLLILCQILILVACALILAKPVRITKVKTDQVENIAIIDSSASMRSSYDGKTRFARAVEQVISLSDDAFSKNGMMSVIIADYQPAYLDNSFIEGAEPFTAKRIGLEKKRELQNLLLDYAESDECSYGLSDIDAAMELSKEILQDNPDAVIYLFTDSSYAHVPEGIKLVNVSAETGEWNASLLNAYSQMEDNYYSFFIDTACYGKALALDVKVTVSGANATERNPEGVEFIYTQVVECTGDATQRLILRNESAPRGDDEKAENTTVFKIPDDQRVVSYKYVRVSIAERDNFVNDNEYFIYGGEKEKIKVLYASYQNFQSGINPFVTGALGVIRNDLRNDWDIEITEVKDNSFTVNKSGALYFKDDTSPTHFDYYIFEHTVPENLPKDGLVFISDPNAFPDNCGLRLNGETRLSSTEYYYLSEDLTNPITENVFASDIKVNRFKDITILNTSAYKPLMSYNGKPMIMIRNDEDAKVIVMSFSVHYSNFPRLPDFYLFMKNIFKTFFPTTLSDTHYEVNEIISLNARGEMLTVSAGEKQWEFKLFPSKLAANLPGTYTFRQRPFGKDEDVIENVYVSIPETECNILAAKDSFTDPRSKHDSNDYYEDWLLYFAIALVSLLFIEWILQARENM